MSKDNFASFSKQITQQVLKGNLASLKDFQYFSRWRDSLQPGKNSISDEQAWITFPAIDFLNNALNSESVVFEYGGGGSSLFFLNRVKKLITVEHDPDWYKILFGIINNQKNKSWTGNLILPEDKSSDISLDPAQPADYFSDDESFSGKTFKAYAASIDKHPDEYFNFVLVDGRVRPSCIVHSIPKIKKGGYLIIDNSNRSYYFKYTANLLSKNFQQIFNRVAPSPYADFFTQTGVWRKTS